MPIVQVSQSAKFKTYQINLDWSPTLINKFTSTHIQLCILWNLSSAPQMVPESLCCTHQYSSKENLPATAEPSCCNECAPIYDLQCLQSHLRIKWSCSKNFTFWTSHENRKRNIHQAWPCQWYRSTNTRKTIHLRNKLALAFTIIFRLWDYSFFDILAFLYSCP